MPFIVGGSYLPDLKIAKFQTQGQIVPLFKVQFSSPDGFALYHLESSDGILDSDWRVSAERPILQQYVFKIFPDPLLCQSRSNHPRFSFEVTENQNEIQINYDVVNEFMAASITFVGGEFVSYHQPGG